MVSKVLKLYACIWKVPASRSGGDADYTDWSFRGFLSLFGHILEYYLIRSFDIELLRALLNKLSVRRFNDVISTTEVLTNACNIWGFYESEIL
jgi:hypothetical protein